MGSSQPFSGSDIFNKLDRQRLIPLGFNDFVPLPSMLLMKHHKGFRRVTFELHAIEDDDRNRHVMIRYDGQRHQITVPLKDVTAALVELVGALK